MKTRHLSRRKLIWAVGLRDVRLSVGALVVAAVVVGCGGSSEGRPSAAGAAGAADASALKMRARQIVDTWVVAVEQEIPLGLAELRRRRWVTRALLTQAEAAYRGGRAGGYDLMTCSQNPLSRYKLGAPVISDGRGRIDVIGRYGAGPFVFVYAFVKTADGWKLDRVDCPAP